MKVKGSWLVVGLSAGLLVSGCASGDNFQLPGPKSLVIGKTRPGQVEELVGCKPAHTKRESNADGKFDETVYSHARFNLKSMRGRCLIVEYRNDVLNGYLYMSSFEQDKTKAAVEKLAQVQRKVSTTNDVLRILGEPDGKAICPTMMPDFKDKCKKGVETWGWFMAGEVNTFAWSTESRKMSTKFVYITFDAKGLVTEVESIENDVR